MGRRVIIAICIAQIIPSLFVGASMATPFEDRWNDMLVRHGVPDDIVKQPVIIAPEPKIKYIPKAKPKPHRFACRHEWHGKHWRC